ncbi:MAG TPA: thiamine pyrophosphate-binding protein [Candidatus Dormibacteraeota bacterium]|nr:thiamine pyrophosphate-binding protein [Candidatus Dormibacteraeota bacterium]
MRTAAAELVTILYDEGVSHVFVSPGANATALRDSLTDAETEGMPHPEPILCAHEQVAILAAHGHHLASGGPQAVVVSVEGPDLNLGGAIHGAQRHRIPMTVFSSAGRATPSPTAGKWSADPRVAVHLGIAARRAFQISRAEPTGVTHVPLPAGALRKPAGELSRRLPPPRPPAPDLAALEEMAELLAAAESPLIVGARVGRHVGAAHLLAKLAETLGAPVIDFRCHVNLPPRHPLNAATEGRDFVAAADAILLLDVALPCVPALGPLPPQAWLLQIDIDCLSVDTPVWTNPVEVAVTADTERALPLLQTLLANRLSGRKVGDRRARIEAQLQARHEAWRARATSKEAGDLLDAVMAELDRALPDDALVLEEAAAGGGVALRQMERPPGHFFRSTSSGPGWSVGAALGARLVRPAQPVVAICDQAAFASGLPTAAFWSAQRAGAPFLTVVLDRSEGVYDPGGVAGEQASEVVAAARAAGAEAAVVSQPSDVAGAVERLLATTRDGLCAVLDVRLPLA